MAVLAGCGQKGALYLPNTPEAQGRASLPQVLSPWHRPSDAARPPASASAPNPSPGLGPTSTSSTSSTPTAAPR